MVQLDPITLSTTWHFLQRIGREMRDVSFRTAVNPLIALLHDVATGIYDSQGRAVAIPEGIRNRMLGLGPQIKIILEQFSGQIFPGDAFMTNDPFRGGAHHLPDWAFIRPIFYKDELVFVTGVSAHVLDSGGAHAGAYFLADDSIAEGLHIPPIKVMERGRMRIDVLDLICSNTRMYEVNRSDTYALIATTALAERRVIELLDRYGKEKVLACVEEMLNRTEKAVRSEIAKMPDGTYYGESSTDDDGVVLDVPVRIRLKLTVKGDNLILDFSESDKQVKGYVNLVYNCAYYASTGIVLAFLGPALAGFHNEGSLKPITVTVPEGSVLNCRPGALVAAFSNLCGPIAEAITQALSKAVPERAVAGWARD